MTKFDATIRCAQRTVSLTTLEGECIEFVTTSPSAAYCAVTLIEGVSLDNIRLMCKYSDVFPDDLSGMPPDRDVEFAIELQPGTTPISRRPYRMPPNELAELKK